MELLACYAFITNRLLGGDSPNSDQQALRALIGTRVFAGAAPSKDSATNKAPVYPMVILSTVTSSNIIVQDGTTAWLNTSIDVKIIGTGSLTDLAAIEALVYTLLQKQSGDAAGCHIMGCHQEAVLIPPPIVDGDIAYNLMIHTYRLRAHRMSG